MNDDCGRYMRNPISTSNQRSEGVTLFCNPKGCAAAETFVEDRHVAAGRFAQHHVGAKSEAAEVSHFEPEGIFVAKEPSGFANGSCRCGDGVPGITGY